MSFASDTFAGASASLNGRTADVGGTWTVRAGTMSSDGAILTVTDYALATLNSATPGSADYDVSVDVKVAADTAPGVVGRAHATDLDYYYFRYLKDSNEYQLYKFAGGSATSLGAASATLTLASTVRLTLRFRGSTISCLADGVEKISVTDTTYASAGVVGIRNGGSGSLATFDNFDAAVPSSHTPGVTIAAIARVSAPRTTGVTYP